MGRGALCILLYTSFISVGHSKIKLALTLQKCPEIQKQTNRQEIFLD